MQGYKTQTLQHRYNKLKTEREPFLQRAKEAAKLTIPSLLPDEDCFIDSGARSFEQPHQSIGADGVNNLSSKLSLTMLPPNDTFYKFDVDKVKLKAAAEIDGRDPAQLDEEVTKGLTNIEQILKNTIEEHGDRVVVGEATKHLIVAGNVLLIDIKGQGLKFYPLSRYVCKRDYIGNVLEVITVESIAFKVLPDEIKELIIKNSNNTEDIEDKSFNLYTGFIRTTRNWKVYQEVEGIKIEANQGTYPLYTSPCIPLRFTRIDGESYGRGFIEDYYGDLKTLDCLSQCVNEASLAAAKSIFLVNPTGVTKIKTLARTKNCQFAVGRLEDVAALQSGKYNDLQVASERANVIEKRLSRLFLLASAVTRDAERVTAEEIRFLKSQLEEALGNVYSILLQEFQKPYLSLKFFHLRKDIRRMPNILNDKNVSITITTGVQALGRTAEIQKMDIGIGAMSQVAPLISALGMDVQTIGDRYAQGIGLNIDGFFIDKQELQKQAQDQQGYDLVKQSAPQLINQMGKLADTQQKQNFEQATNKEQI